MNKWVPRLLLAGAVLTLVTTPWLVAKYHQSNTAAQALPSFESVVPPPLREPGPRVVYKWRDNKGVLHYADQPPSNHRWQAITLGPPGGADGAAKAKKNDPADSAAVPLSVEPPRHVRGNGLAPANPFAIAYRISIRTFALDRHDSDQHWD